MFKNPNTTLCYVERDGKYLMMHRVKKENDLNKDKWVGIGGHIEETESPGECIRREAMEEAGLTLHSVKPRAFITFVSDEWGTEYMHLFTTDDFSGELIECDEGELCWVDKRAVYDLPIWVGDKIFFKLLEEDVPYFYLKLVYEGDRLTEAVLNDVPVDPKKYLQ